MELIICMHYFRTKSISVIMSKCGISSGTCDKECATIDLVEDVECGCSCQLTASSCRPVDQVYRADLCACACRDDFARQTCLDAGGLWDESACECGCGGRDGDLECGVGEVFSRATCSCKPLIPSSLSGITKKNKTVVAAKPKSAGDNNSGVDNRFFFPTFELVIILILLSIIFVLVIIVFSLIMKIQRMNHRTRLQRLKAGGLQRPGSPEEHQQYAESAAGRPSSTATDEDDGGFNPKEQQQQQQQVYSQINRSGSGSGGGTEFTDVNCSTPSSGFYSELGSGGGGAELMMEQLYHSAEQVRNNKMNNKVRARFI